MDLVYQNFPFGAARLKSWVQTESEDLVHFKETGVTSSRHSLDSHGAYSGSANAVW